MTTLAAQMTTTQSLLAERQAYPTAYNDAKEYAKLQDTIPPGSRVLEMTDNPYYFDYSRNDILNIDLPGAASPKPGIPLFSSADEVAKYLLERGIRYWAFVNPASSHILYNRGVWESHSRGNNRLWRGESRFYLQVMAVVDQLAASRRRVFDDGYMVAVDLATPTAVSRQ
jgi:hypothetical protein